MNIERIVSKGLSHFSYIVESGGEIAVIDPRRDIWIYIDRAEDLGARIKYIFETHRHEDLVSGGLELWERTGAPVYHGKDLAFGYGEPIRNGDMFELGSFFLEVLETPGHTDESISIILKEKEDKEEPLAVFTGDAIFYGDVGRTDLYGREKREENATRLFSSIHDVIIPLGDHVVLYPAHGTGSVCGGSLKPRDISTIGYERRRSPLLKMKKNEFISFKNEEDMELPPYFSVMEVFNKEGPRIISVPERIRPVDARRTLEMKDEGAKLLDIRDPASFASGHIPGSLNIWLEGLPAFGGWFLNYEEPILIVDHDCSRMDTVWKYLTRLGMDNVKICLSGGFQGYSKMGQEISGMEMVDVNKMKDIVKRGEGLILDVRDGDSWKRDGHIEGARRIYVGDLPGEVENLPMNRKITIYCDSGYKTGIAGSILLSRGFVDVKMLQGGMNAWKNSNGEVLSSGDE